MERRQLMRALLAGSGLSSAEPILAKEPARAPAPPREASNPFQKLRILIPANRGGGWDQTGRALGAALQTAGQAVDVEYENKGGKGGVVGLAHFVGTYGPDPAALMVGGFVMVGSVALNKPAIDLSRVHPVARLTNELLVLVVPANSPYRTLAPFIADLKRDPGGVTIAGGGAGGVDHMCAAMIARAAGIDAGRLSYKPFSSGSEVMAAVGKGQVAAAISGYGELKDSISAGTTRALGVTSRGEAFGIPSMAHQGVPVELINWRGVFAASGLSSEQVARLREVVQRATQHSGWREALQRNNWRPAWLSGTAFEQSLEWDLGMARLLLHLLHLK
jgi:putative tricarboxylic transport membrane protein